MQRFELSPNDTNKLLTREPLLIVRLSILSPISHTMRPVKKKPYQEYTFAFCIPLELDGDDLDLLKLDYLSWLRLLGEVLRIAPPYFTMGETLEKYLDMSITTKWTLSFKQMISSRSLSLSCTSTWSTLYFIFFFHNDDVLRMHMRVHSILFLKTHSI
jgi:hypothetical protein